MSSGVFVIKKDGSLVEMKQTDYDSEDVLQKLLADYPNLLAGNLIDEVIPRKWLLISREYGIPDDEHAGNRWAIDHLFLDQDGIPTLVEVKRSSDTRVRREVVGQMLEYAANAVSYWNIEQIKSKFESRCELENQDPKQTWNDQFQLEDSYEEYWGKVNDNLQTGKIRLLFIADIIPLELRQIVEFLNTQMNPAEVLALEIKQYIGKDQSTLIPRLYGQTSKTQARKKIISKGERWTKQTILAAIEERVGQQIAETANIIMTWTETHIDRIDYGSGFRNGSYIPFLKIEDDGFWSYVIWSSGIVEIQFQYIKNQVHNGGLERRTELLNRLNSIKGVYLENNRIDKRPSFPLSVLNNKVSLDQFYAIWEDYFEEIRNKY